MCVRGVLGLLAPLGERSLVEPHVDGLVLLDRVVEDAAHPSVRAHRLLNGPHSPAARADSDAAEVEDVRGVEEHPSDDRRALVHSHRRARQHDLLEHHTVGVCPRQTAARHQLEAARRTRRLIEHVEPTRLGDVCLCEESGKG